MLYTKLALFVGLLAAGTQATDVFSIFYNGNIELQPHHDISDGGCFQLDQATSISFSQHADGPYCLNAWKDANCPGLPDAQQGFANVGAPKNGLNVGVAGVNSYKWQTDSCNGITKGTPGSRRGRF